MKTFLHYTKEKQLDEGIMSALGDAVGAAGRIGGKVLDVAGKVGSAMTGDTAKNIGGILGGKDGKLSTTLSALGDRKEQQEQKRQRCKRLRANEIPRAQRELQKAQNALNTASTSGGSTSDAQSDVDYWTEELDELQNDLKKYKC